MTGRNAKCIFRGFAVAYAAAALTCAAQTATTEAPIEKTFTEGDVKLEISIDPATVDLGRDTIVLIHLAHPEGIDVNIPEEMSGRFEGFDLAGYYSTPHAPAGGLASTTYNFRLTPKPGGALPHPAFRRHHNRHVRPPGREALVQHGDNLHPVWTHRQHRAGNGLHLHRACLYTPVFPEIAEDSRRHRTIGRRRFNCSLERVENPHLPQNPAHDAARTRLP